MGVIRLLRRPEALVLSPRRPSVLLVCTANICRSPMAEGVLRKLAARAGIEADIDSAGTCDYGLGLPPFPLAVATAKRRGYDITALRSRIVRPNDFEYFDAIVAMDSTNQRELRRRAPGDARQKVHLLLHFSAAYRGEEVRDPYGKGPFEFERALRRIESGCHGLLRHMKETSRVAVA